MDTDTLRTRRRIVKSDLIGECSPFFRFTGMLIFASEIFA